MAARIYEKAIMKLTFRHKGLKAFADRGSLGGILPSHAARLRECLSLLRNARSLADLKRFIHPMSTGSALDGFWAMKVTAQWRLVFKTDGTGICRDIDYRNYH